MHRTRHAVNRHTPVIGSPRAPIGGKSQSRGALAKECGPIVYFAQCDGLIKIGFTDGWLESRKCRSQLRWDDFLAITPGTIEDEAAYHARFAPHRAKGREWYHEHPDIFAVINEIRAGYGLSLIEA